MKIKHFKYTFYINFTDFCKLRTKTDYRAEHLLLEIFSLVDWPSGPYEQHSSDGSNLRSQVFAAYSYCKAHKRQVSDRLTLTQSLSLKRTDTATCCWSTVCLSVCLSRSRHPQINKGPRPVLHGTCTIDLSVSRLHSIKDLPVHSDTSTTSVTHTNVCRQHCPQVCV